MIQGNRGKAERDADHADFPVSESGLVGEKRLNPCKRREWNGGQPHQHDLSRCRPEARLPIERGWKGKQDSCNAECEVEKGYDQEYDKRSDEHFRMAGLIAGAWQRVRRYGTPGAARL